MSDGSGDDEPLHNATQVRLIEKKSFRFVSPKCPGCGHLFPHEGPLLWRSPPRQQPGPTIVRRTGRSTRSLSRRPWLGCSREIYQQIDITRVAESHSSVIALMLDRVPFGSSAFEAATTSRSLKLWPGIGLIEPQCRAFSNFAINKPNRSECKFQCSFSSAWSIIEMRKGLGVSVACRFPPALPPLLAWRRFSDIPAPGLFTGKSHNFRDQGDGSGQSVGPGDAARAFSGRGPGPYPQSRGAKTDHL